MRTKPMFHSVFGLVYKVMFSKERTNWYTKNHIMVFPTQRRFSYYNTRHWYKTNIKTRNWIKRGSIWNK